MTLELAERIAELLQKRETLLRAADRVEVERNHALASDLRAGASLLGESIVAILDDTRSAHA